MDIQLLNHELLQLKMFRSQLLDELENHPDNDELLLQLGKTQHELHLKIKQVCTIEYEETLRDRY